MNTIAVSMALIGALYCGALTAAPITSADKVQFRNGKVFVTQNNALAEAKTAVSLPFEIIVNTNGAYTVGGGRARQLFNGESLDRNGMLLKADGTIVPVMDHVTLNRGRVMVMKDGDYAPLKGTLKLGDGSTISDDDYLTPRNGPRRRLLDGEIFHLKGGALPAQDTVSLKDGVVTVQKDGSAIIVGAGRTIMMNDGTKVFSDGTIVRFSGEKAKLREGETLVIEGVKRK